MINKKNFLGSEPVELGLKDAVHVAIASVRAAKPLHRGQACSLNKFGEAIPGGNVGVVNPFRSGRVEVGETFWMLVDPNKVDNVSHTWSHPEFAFEKPTRDIVQNEYIARYAKDFKVSYSELMAACKKVVHESESTVHPLGLSQKEVDNIQDKMDVYDLWYEWSDETGFSFPNYGSACCPELSLPGTPIFHGS